MGAWKKERLHEIAITDDLHIAPFREDGATTGTPTWIWSVVVDGDLYRCCVLLEVRVQPLLDPDDRGSRSCSYGTHPAGILAIPNIRRNLQKLRSIECNMHI